jgi:hypothetical protein
MVNTPVGEHGSTLPETLQAPVEVAVTWASKGKYVGPGCAPRDGQCGCGKGHTGRDVGKAPLTPHGHLDFSNDPATVRALFAKHPHANVLLDLERSGMGMIDPDSPEAFDEVVQHGVPPTQMRMSRNHAFLCDRPADCPPTSVKRIGRDSHLDVLADGYAVIYGEHQTGCRVYTADAPRAELPAWAVVILQQAAQNRERLPVQFTPDPDAAAKGAALWPKVRPDCSQRVIATVEGGPSAYTPRQLTSAEVAAGHRPLDPSGSGADAAVITMFIERGLDDDQILQIYSAFPIGTQGKFGQRGGAKYLARTIGKQRAWLKQSAAEAESMRLAPPATTPDPTPAEGSSTPTKLFPRPEDLATYCAELEAQNATLETALEVERRHAAAAKAALDAYHAACCSPDARTVAAITYELATRYRPAPHPDLPDGYAPLWVGERDEPGSLAARTQRCGTQVRNVIEKVKAAGHVEIHRYEKPGPDGKLRTHLAYRVPVLAQGGTVTDVLRALPEDTETAREAAGGALPGRPRCDSHPEAPVREDVFEVEVRIRKRCTVRTCEEGGEELSRQYVELSRTEDYLGRRHVAAAAVLFERTSKIDPEVENLLPAATEQPIEIISPSQPEPVSQKVCPISTRVVVSEPAVGPPLPAGFAHWCPTCPEGTWRPLPSGVPACSRCARVSRPLVMGASE